MSSARWIVMVALAAGGCGSSPEPCAPDVPAAFRALGTEPLVHEIDDGPLFQGDEAWLYTLTPENEHGIDNHFQGVQRQGRYAFVSGGDVKLPRADVFVADLDLGAWIGTLPLQAGDEWHAGGIDLTGGLLAVPTERLRGVGDGLTSSIRLLDVRDPQEPALITVLDRGPDTLAHAAGLARVRGGHLLVNWDDRRFAFYRSQGEDPAQGFEDAPFAELAAGDVSIEVAEVGTPGVHGQSLSLLEQCDGELYAVMADNTNPLPVSEGVDYLELYRLVLRGDEVSMTKIGSRAVFCPGPRGCNFVAAGGAWLDAEGRLRVSGVPHFRDHHRGVTVLSEFVEGG